MGTNFYLMSKNKQLMREYFAEEKSYGIINEEYAIVDEPYLGYRVHLNKLSSGWRPLFQRHKTIKTFKDLESFCLDNKGKFGIYDEYGEKYTWEQYFNRVYGHSQCPAETYKWVYEQDKLFRDDYPTLHIIKCTEEEAEIYVPFSHRLYAETEKQATECFGVDGRRWYDIEYWDDPDYPFDWTDREFS